MGTGLSGCQSQGSHSHPLDWVGTSSTQQRKQGLTSMEKHPPGDASLPGAFSTALLCTHLLGFVPAPPCAAEPVGQGQTERGAGWGSIHNSVLKTGTSLVIFISGEADKEFWWSICKHRKCPHHLPCSCISASLTLSRTEGAGYGSLSLTQNVMPWDELLKL